MTYSIIFMKGEKAIGTTPWAGSLDSAKKHAQDHLLIKKADRVEVRDEDGKLMFHHPRMLRA